MGGGAMTDRSLRSSPEEAPPSDVSPIPRESLGDAAVVAPAGHFRIYLGAVAGVGKTFAMLNEGHRRRGRGTDLVVGFVETHGRAHTEELLDGLEAVPRTSLEYRGCTFEEMDLDAVLARHPQVALIDEIAHTNVPGSGKNEKRWQDILEILDAGIDVITTVNIQHFESIADAVERMTGVAVRERVPDWVIRKANQIELVDSSPEALRRRMLHGNIYPEEKVPQALTHFFRTENLVALRELALRYVADATEKELLDHLGRYEVSSIWETTERILVGATGAPGTDAIMRRAARMAARVHAELHVVHVRGGDGAGRSDRKTIKKLHNLAIDLGAHWDDVQADDPAQALMDYARKNQITQIVLGSTRRSRWEELTKGSVAKRILREAADVDTDVHVIARRAVGHEPPEPDGPAEES
jgi:two-component system sensor histidine kinase KdpD